MTEYPIDGRRVSIEESFADFVQSIATRDGETGVAPFATTADLVAFAAAYAASETDPLPVKNKASRPSPIRYEVFVTKDYESLIDLLAAFNRNDVRTLKSSEESLNERLEIFEGYANAGIQLMKSKLDPFADKMEGLELLLSSSRNKLTEMPSTQDLSDLL
jgi:dnd system-associated protein 4